MEFITTNKLRPHIEDLTISVAPVVQDCWERCQIGGDCKWCGSGSSACCGSAMFRGSTSPRSSKGFQSEPRTNPYNHRYLAYIP